MSRLLVFLLLVAPCALGAEAAMHHEMILRNGTLYDGGGGAPFVADLAIDGDRIAAIGDLSGRTADSDIDVEGLAVAPGFINMLSWSNLSLLQDGRSLSDIRQGVTLEVMGEGHSMGPLNEAMKQEKRENQSDIRYDVAWTTLGEYLQHLEDRGVSTNVASFVGASTVRQHVMGYEDRAASADELMQMKELVEGAMLEGAMGLSSALVYVPGNFAGTGELVELAGVAAGFDGLYTSHMRNEGKTIFDALDEFMTIVRESGIRGEIYHLKVSGKENWDKLDKVILRIEAARAEGLPVTADIYPYHASSTGLTIELPGWAKEGGQDALIERLKDPALRPKIAADMDMIPPGDLMLTNFENPALRHLIGKTLADVSEQRGTSPEETAFDLIVEDDSRVGTVRFTMSEDNIRKKIALPWVSFCSDSSSQAPEPPFTFSQPHPRGYGAFARLLGKYVREEQVIPLEEAIHRLTRFPARNLRLEQRGGLEPGFFADVVVFDPATIIDRATFEEPHQLAVGVMHVFVNGEQVLRDGEHTGARPGRFVRGPGYRP
ncbi:MAG: D-aminoacylase [Xanthomonadales bacterium]|nr:D-aminoacylase [Gammaproteobacteria bacterium]MBT8056532.1 D-aminoacylase [Gammaproteobacteria bacterium]NNJ79916.1 D-aminoacylase [Xanthomonadales bacterium]NNL05986.1 D-aminoacylase [Xanthomonadales bacterium]